MSRIHELDHSFSEEGDGWNEEILLLRPEGEARLRMAMELSGGNAVVIVHPFAPDNEIVFDQLPARKMYRAYETDLRISLENAQRNGIPLVLFERAEAMDELENTRKRMGIVKGSLFVVPTQTFAPTPLDSDLDTFSQELARLGMREVTIVGSYFNSPSVPFSKIRSANRQLPYLKGCVGMALTSFNNAGIGVRPGITVSSEGWSTR